MAQPATVSPIPLGAALTLAASRDGVGHFLYVPYYSAQSGNNTMINLVNTDTVNGKAVKVRFRAAANSDDVFDFQVFLSPSDVWAAMVTKGADGKAALTTSDVSCTKPAKAILTETAFKTVRSDTKGRTTAEALANEGREGYVEIFNMADIPPLKVNDVPTNPLYIAIKHVTDVAPCSGTAWAKLDVDPIGIEDETIGTIRYEGAKSKGLYVPTTGLFANWIILNANDAGAWSGAATAINAVTASRVPTTGALTYFPQTNETLNVSASRVLDFSSDPFLFKNPGKASVFDLPDFSIPYTASSDPTFQVSKLSDAIATTRIFNEFLSDTATTTTDWVLSMPTRRYYAAYDYISDAVMYSPANYQSLTPSRTFSGVEYFNPQNTIVKDRQVCITGLNHASYNREETTAINPGADVIVSPVDVTDPTKFVLCGEVSVMSFNQGEKAGTTGLITTASGTLKATVARSAIENGYASGWTTLFTPGPDGSGMPILGFEAIRAVAGTNTFGATLPHRTDLKQK